MLSSIVGLAAGACGNGAGVPDAMTRTIDASATAVDATETPDEPDAAPGDPTATMRIAEENRREGTTAWELGKPAMSGQVEGYANPLSVASGGKVELAISANPAGPVTWRIFRMGWYGGKGGREVHAGGTISAETQAAPSFDPVTGLVRAGWPKTLDVDTGGWLTGVYLVKLENASGFGSYVPFIVRDDRRDAEIALQLPTATWQAYNRWGGESLYASSHGMSGGKARKVSYDRPIHPELGFGSGLFHAQERPAVAWLEANGYDVEYLTSADVGGERNRLGSGHRIYVTVGHDEYNSLISIERIAAAADAGVNVAFLTGNTLYWQIRWEDGGRTQVCYKDKVSEDPLVGVDDRHVATSFRAEPVNRPENGFIGIMSEGRTVPDNVDWVVAKADHWLYEGTGLKNGDRIRGIVGFEWDTFFDNGAAPPGLVILADGPVNSFAARHNATIYTRGSAFVFAAGTIDFTRKLDDAHVDRMMRNLLEKAGARPY